MSSHVELNPDDSTLGLSLGMKAMRLALTQKTHKMGTVRIPGTGGTDVIIGVGASDGANRIDQDGRQLPLVDTSGIDKAAQDAQQKADAAAAKADQVRSDLQAEVDKVRANVADVDAKAERAKTSAEAAASKADSDKAELDKSVAALGKRVSDVSAKGDKMAGQITDITGTVNGQQTKLDEFGTKLDGTITRGDTTVKSVSELKQTVAGLSSTVSQMTKTASDALSKATSVEQTANGLKATISKDYQTTKQADGKYSTKTELSATSESLSAGITAVKKTADGAVTSANAAQATADGVKATLSRDYTSTKNADLKYSTKAELSATSDSLSSSISSVRGTADGAVAAASKAQQTADAVTLNLSKNYQTKAQNDALYATQTSLKATSDSLSANITANAKTAQSAVDKATSLEANLNGFKTTVAETYTTKNDFNNLSVGGTNLLVKSNFIKSWINTQNGTLAYPDDPVSDSEWNGDSSSKKPITVDPNTTYVLSAYDSMTDTVKNTGRISQFDSEGTFINFVVPGISLRDKGHITFTTDENAASILVGIYSFPRYRWKLEKGTKPTDWSPAPEDLQPAGDYATNSSVTQTANSIKAEVTEVSKTANGAMSKATTVEQTANGLSSKITEQGKTLNATVTTANEAKHTADSNKTAISQVSTTASNALTKASTVEQNLNGFKTAVSQTYGRGSNLWVNPTFDADKPQITTRVNNVTAPNGSGVNLLANRDHYNGSTGFPVVPGHVYAITAHIKRIKGNLDLLADIWYTEMTSGVSWDSSVIREPAVELTDGWSSMTWRVTCSSGKSKGCVNFRIDQWDHSTQFYVANLVCVDVTGLQPAGDYATNSSLTQTANSIKAQVTEVSKTANGAMSKATTVEQTANGLSSKITEQAKTLNATVRTANEAKSTADSNKTTISQVSTTASSALSKASTVEQNLNGFKTSVADTYQPKSGMGSYATQSQLTQTANQIRGEVSEKYQSKNGMSSYATNSALTQKANEITGKVTEVAKTAQGNATTISQVSQKADRINTTLSQQIGGKADTSRVSSLEQNLNGFKTSVAKTYQTKGDYPTKAEVQSRIDQSASSIKSTVGQTYTTLAATEELRKSAIRTFPLYGANGTGPKWVKLGYLISNGDSSSVLLRVYSGDGYNGQARQNAEFEIFVKDGWQGAPSASGAFGVSVRRIRSADDVKVKVMAFGPTTCDIWAYLPWHWWNGRYTIQGYYKSWQDGPNCGGERIQDNEPANGTAQNLAYDTLSTRSYVDQTSRSVALGVVQNYKGSDGSGLATKSDITVAKNSITSTVAGTYATKSGVTQEISSKITQNNNSLDVKFSTKTETKTAQDTANTAKSNASNAQSRVGALEDCISLTSAGVRAGHKSNGVFNGVSALVNTDGSFDLLDKDGNLLTRIDRHSLQVAGDDGVGSGHLILSQDGLDITVQPTANKKATYHIQLGAGGISITAPDGSHVNCSARTGLDLETVRYGKLSIGSGGLQFTNDQGWGLLLSAAGWSLKWAGNHTLATGPTAGKLYIDGREIMTR